MYFFYIWVAINLATAHVIYSHLHSTNTLLQLFEVPSPLNILFTIQQPKHLLYEWPQNAVSRRLIVSPQTHSVFSTRFKISYNVGSSNSFCLSAHPKPNTTSARPKPSVSSVASSIDARSTIAMLATFLIYSSLYPDLNIPLPYTLAETFLTTLPWSNLHCSSRTSHPPSAPTTQTDESPDFTTGSPNLLRYDHTLLLYCVCPFRNRFS